MEHQLEERNSSGAVAATAIFTSNRTFADLVQSELNRIEVESFRAQNKYIREFLPDNFSKAGGLHFWFIVGFKREKKCVCAFIGDNDCILLAVFFTRMAAKAQLLARLLGERFSDVPDGMEREHVVRSHKAEQWATVRRYRYLLDAVAAVMRRFESVICNCTAESLSRLALIRADIAYQETHIDRYFDALRENRFDENWPTENLERAVLFFQVSGAVFMRTYATSNIQEKNLQKQLSLYVSAGEYDTRAAMSDFIQRYVDGLDWVRCNCARLRLFLSADDAEAAAAHEAQDWTAFLFAVEALANDIAGCSLRARKLIPTEQMLDFSAIVCVDGESHKVRFALVAAA